MCALAKPNPTQGNRKVPKEQSRDLGAATTWKSRVRHSQKPGLGIPKIAGHTPLRNDGCGVCCHHRPASAEPVDVLSELN